jgi:hypothetical protein
MFDLGSSAFAPIESLPQLEGYGLRLRPVTVADDEFIIALRSYPRVLGTMGDTVPDPASQRCWIESHFAHDGEFECIMH